jgi:hypothetical protein
MELAARENQAGFTEDTELALRAPIILTPRTPEVPIPFDSPVIQTVNTIWDEANFGIQREPVVVGSIEDKAGFENTEGIKKISWLPIKLPGTEYVLPPEYEQFREALEKMIGFEHAINPDVDETYAYFTVDAGFVEAGNTHRKKGAHSDGFQSILIDPKNKTSRFYAAFNAVPTLHHNQPFDVSHLDPGIDNFFWEFERQVDPARTEEVDPYDIVMMDAYTVHEAGEATEDTSRVFMRLSYEYRPFNRRGNAINPYLDYDWGEQVPCRCQIPPLLLLR